MAGERAIAWRRLFAEGATIVVGILLALAADAAWEQRGERIAESEELDRLLVELETNLVRFSGDVAAQAAMIQDLNRLYTILSAGDAGATVEVGDSIALALLVAPTWDPDEAVLNALVGSGRMRLISDPSIREGIAAWGSRLEGAQEQQARSRAVYMEQILPYLTRTTDIERLLANRQLDVSQYLGARDAVEAEGRYPWQFAQGSTRLPNTQEMRNLVSQRLLFAGMAHTSSAIAVQSLEGLVETIRASR